MANVYFEQIRNIILKELDNAANIVQVAVAWFTDEIIFNKLLDLSDSGVYIELIILDDKINKDCSLEYRKLIKNGNNNLYLFAGQFETMHHKFCIIDLKTIITGSYNWTNRARRNKENIIVIKDDSKAISAFNTEFNILKNSQYCQANNNHMPLSLTKNAGLWFQLLDTKWKYIITNSLQNTVLVLESYEGEKYNTNWRNNEIEKLNNIQKLIKTKKYYHPDFQLLKSIKYLNIKATSYHLWDLRQTMKEHEFEIEIFINGIDDYSIKQGKRRDKALKEYYENNSLNNLSPLSYFSELEILEIYELKIDDFTAISTLLNLRKFKLYNLKCNDVKFLSNICYLEELYLYSTGLIELPIFNSSSKLKIIDISSTSLNKIDSIGTLKELICLTLSDAAQLDISDDVISINIKKITFRNVNCLNIKLTSPRKQLNEICLTKCNLKNVSFLKYTPQVESLDLSHNEVNDLTPIMKLNKITNLNIKNTKTSNLNFVENLKSIENLWVSTNTISNIDVLANCNKLKILDIKNNLIKDISALSNLFNINRLYLSNNPIGQNIKYLSELKNIKELYLDNCQLDNIIPIKNMIKLSSLNLSSNNLRDYKKNIFGFETKLNTLTPLNNLSNIRYLDISKNDIKYIVNIPNVAYSKLDISNTKIVDITPLTKIDKNKFNFIFNY